MTSARGVYRVSGEDYAPAVGFISYARQPESPHDDPNPLPPDLAVEVLSPSDNRDTMRVKVVNYLAAGTVVWLVDPDAQIIEVYTPGQPVQRLGIDATIDGGDVLPGFELAVEAVFP